ncbi:MAG: hypothetical protein J6Q78_01995 [Clostridia bacterium]|nr:hypothetical protein [Clostridia bacterium]
MKKLLALLLILCMCTAMLASCDMGDIFGVEDGSSDKGDGNGGDDSESDGSSGTNDDKMPDISDMEKVKGEEITESDFQQMNEGFTNFTVVLEMEGMYDGEANMPNKLVVKVAGDSYEEYTYCGDTLFSADALFNIDGSEVYCIYDMVTKKWIKNTDGYSSAMTYPLMDMPIELDDFTYDNESGSYIIENFEADGEKLNIEMKFKDGKCVYCRVEQDLMGHNVTMKYAFSNYGTTKVTTPDAKDIIMDEDKEESMGPGTEMIPDVNDGPGAAMKPDMNDSDNKGDDSVSSDSTSESVDPGYDEFHPAIKDNNSDDSVSSDSKSESVDLGYGGSHPAGNY